MRRLTDSQAMTGAGTPSAAPRVTKRLYSIEEAAEYLGRSEWGVRRLIWGGKLPYVRHGRRVHLDVTDMDTFIEGNKIVEHDP